MKRMIFVMLFAMVILSVNGFADFAECYYSNNTPVNISDMSGWGGGGVGIFQINLGEDLRCNDTSAFVNDDLGTGFIENYGNLTFDNFNLTFSASFNGNSYMYSDGADTKLVINNTNITSSSNHYFLGGGAGTIIIINYSYIQEAGWNDADMGRGIEVMTGAKINITNSTMENCFAGVTLQTNDNFIVNNTFNDNIYGVYTITSSDNTISDNIMYSNTVGSYFLNSANNIITNNTMTSNSGSGVYFVTSSNSTIVNNTFNSTNIGISLETSSNNNTIANNTANSNTDGIYLYTSSNNNTIINNIVNSNSNRGIHISTSSNNNTIVNNTANSNINGIYISSSSDNNTIINNTASSNGGNGIYLYTSSNNTIINNTASSNGGNGIYLYTSSNNNTIVNNTANSNSNGIYLFTSSNNTIINNIIRWNTGYGISELASSGHVYLNNSLYENGYTSFLTPNLNRVISAGTLHNFNISVHLPNDTLQGFTLNTITMFPNISVENTSSNYYIIGNFTPEKIGRYSFRINITDNDNNTIVHSFPYYIMENSYVDDVTETINYYIRPDVIPTHNQPTGSDAKAILLTAPTTDNQFSCLFWVQASLDDIPSNYIGIIKNVNISFWYRSTGTPFIGIQKDVSYDRNVNLNQSLSVASDWTNGNVEFLPHWEMENNEDWYNFSIKLDGTVPILRSGPGNLSNVTIIINPASYTLINVSTLMITMPDYSKHLSSTFTASDLKSKEVIVDGEGIKEIEIQMPEVATYNVYRDSVLCNSVNTDCNYTQTGTTLNVILNLGSEHTILIQESDPPVRSAGSPIGTVRTTSTTLSLTTDESAVCKYSTGLNTIYSAMTSTATSSSTTHSWPLTSLSNGVHSYYIRCNDTFGNYNTNDYSISFVVSIPSSGGGGIIDLPITKPIRPAEDPTDTAEIIEDPIVGETYVIPTGGLGLRLDYGMYLNTFGTNVTINNLTKINPNDYHLLLCNQTLIYAYEIDVTADEAYLCFDKNLTDVDILSISTIVNGKWTKLETIIENEYKICGKIKSSPYMISGFSSSS
ncbi:MAG: right-handed parallel beta-helix repeat-containing protein, partial [Nanoarchaeota archaeon]|nr:right-handed parallel beta-helix repeat-containing protein [Nanoarchaeota archaeon]